jgi:DNA-binding MarR family transcriptional regulator
VTSSAGSRDGNAYLAGSSDEALAADLHSAALHLLRRLRATDASLGISPTRLSALSVIVFGGPLSLRDLAAAEQVRPPSMSRVVAALEEAGLVSRQPDPSDGRAILLEATPEGVRVMHLGRALRVQSLAEQLRTLSKEERATLRRASAILQRLESAET